MNNIALGHLAPKGYKVNRFNYVKLNHLWHCKSHNFVFDINKEEEKLYNAMPCFFTDNRYSKSDCNFYQECYLYHNRKKTKSLKSCIRLVKKCQNIPLNTIVKFSQSWYYPGKKIKNLFNFKVTKENLFDPQYQINKKGYIDNFITCEFSKNLTNALRQNGFIVEIINEEDDDDEKKYENKRAIAYGHGKKIGYSASDDRYWGYFNGKENILWDELNCFDKWSRCNEIPKDTPIDEIIKILKQPNK